MSEVPTRLVPGQRWQYRTRSGEEGSRLTILKLEDWRGESVVHVALDGLALKNPHAREGFSTTLGHTPISEATLRRCLGVLEQADCPLPDYESGYRNWKTAAENSEGNHFSIDLSEIVDSLENALNSVQAAPERGLFQKVNRRLLSADASPRCPSFR